MVSPIGSSPYPIPASFPQSIGGLEAQLQRYQKELSDCVNCDSANTHEGRQTIQALSSKISEIKTRIEEVVVAKSTAQSTTIKDSPESGAQHNNAGETVSALNSATTTVVNRLDVFA